MIRSVGSRHATLDACKFKIYSSTVLSGHLEILAQEFHIPGIRSGNKQIINLIQGNAQQKWCRILGVYIL
jgi:hypothetical protein